MIFVFKKILKIGLTFLNDSYFFLVTIDFYFLEPKNRFHFSVLKNNKAVPNHKLLIFNSPDKDSILVMSAFDTLIIRF